MVSYIIWLILKVITSNYKSNPMFAAFEYVRILMLKLFVVLILVTRIVKRVLMTDLLNETNIYTFYCAYYIVVINQTTVEGDSDKCNCIFGFKSQQGLVIIMKNENFRNFCLINITYYNFVKYINYLSISKLPYLQ